MRVISRCNIITEVLQEEIVEWVIFNPNFKPSCVLSDTGIILKPESNQKEVCTKCQCIVLIVMYTMIC